MVLRRVVALILGAITAAIMSLASCQLDPFNPPPPLSPVEAELVELQKKHSANVVEDRDLVGGRLETYATLHHEGRVWVSSGKRETARLRGRNAEQLKRRLVDLMRPGTKPKS